MVDFLLDLGDTISDTAENSEQISANHGNNSIDHTNSNAATIFNLTSRILSDDTMKLLEKGLKFVPTPSNHDEVEI